jgi:hypothetical protein
VVLRRLASVGLAIGGALAAVAPFLDWFRVTVVADGRSRIGTLAGTAYGVTTTAFGILAIVVALLLLRERRGWRWWPAVGAAAMFFVLVTGLRGAFDPLGSGKAALSEEAALDLAGVEPGLVDDRGFRIRLAIEFNEDRLAAESLVGSRVAGAGGAPGGGWGAAPWVSCAVCRWWCAPPAAATDVSDSAGRLGSVQVVGSFRCRHGR